MTEATSETDLVIDETSEETSMAVAPPRPADRTRATDGQRLAKSTHREIIVVTSGKGGVGKTTTSASLACGLARRGKRVAVIDFDIGLRNLDLVMGCERRVVYDFVNVINGDCTLKQALIKDKRIETLFVLAASQTRDKDALSSEGVRRVLDDLIADGFDYIICDSPAGIEKGAHLAMYYADRAVVVVNPEVSSVRDSDRILGLLASKTQRAEKGGTGVNEHLLLTRYSPRRVATGEMMSVGDVKEILGLDVVGVIPESPDVLTASNAGTPVILNEESDVATRLRRRGHPAARRVGAAAVHRRTQEGPAGPHVRRLRRWDLLALFRRRPPSANVAKERLRIIVAQERSTRGGPDYLPVLRARAAACHPQVRERRRRGHPGQLRARGRPGSAGAVGGAAGAADATPGRARAGVMCRACTMQAQCRRQRGAITAVTSCKGMSLAWSSPKGSIRIDPTDGQAASGRCLRRNESSTLRVIAMTSRWPAASRSPKRTA